MRAYCLDVLVVTALSKRRFAPKQRQLHFVCDAVRLASPPDVADRAFRHATQKENRRHGETTELGPFRFYTENAKPPEDLDELKKEFTNKKGRERNWDENSLSKKISIVADTYGDQMYLALGSPYICWYGTSSERIHSSLYGTLRYLGRKDIQDVYSHLIIELTECISNCGVATAGMLEILGKESGLKEFSDADKTLRDMVLEFVETISDPNQPQDE